MANDISDVVPNKRQLAVSRQPEFTGKLTMPQQIRQVSS